MKIKIDTGRENFGNPRKMKLRKLRTKRASSARSVCKAKGAGECTTEKKKKGRGNGRADGNAKGDEDSTKSVRADAKGETEMESRIGIYI